ncbi:calcium/sodium antiporter [Vibrio fluvialis]|uniref:calcium/sodium antiporter n=1 Tax=Vibrio TaxID=662 RepID=UPI000D2050FF|nr:MULTISPECIES: calcium/sodium antiporter [Vibrio]EKO3965106.1 calcium/sodium antiporter [Vibrio fluvialis]MBY8126157.1 calcium/sodium antiporter [Vibrio fluvialis]MCE7594362.1 calcium/sodium antiporter [Vibrio fluvialis]UHJ60378.1 calcium/sodium antiporter [Vibrio furnissii]SPM19915.1 inner membrane protein YrbG,Inner membrane protei n yrbG,putative calcium/sodium:proton antiporter,Ca2 /H an tiporter,K -dependent Na /Ca exchanger homolog,Sodium/calc ium exchanger protein [Vibrio cholerae]
MLLASLAIIAGFALLVWSADKFVEGAAASANYAGMPPLLIGMLVVGFGTSAPEMVVSAMAAMNGNSALALGNAVGSNIVNITLILGVTAIIAPIAVHSSIIRKELPILLLITLVIGAMLWNHHISTLEAWALIGGFMLLIGWSIWSALHSKGDHLEQEMDEELSSQSMSLKSSIFWLITGLVLLIISSRILVWGAVEIAQQLGVSDLLIGLTIVALGTSLPELAASIVAARKGEHDIAVGNVVGSNMFNSLAVIGIAGTIEPIANIGAEVFWRDWTSMLFVTGLLLLTAARFGKSQTISRSEGAVLLLCYLGYNGYLIYGTL